MVVDGSQKKLEEKKNKAKKLEGSGKKKEKQPETPGETRSAPRSTKVCLCAA